MSGAISLSRIWADPSTRLTLYLSCLFGGLGVALPFLPRWLEAERGLSGFEIGAVLSTAQLVRFAIGPLIAAWADGFKDRRTPLVLMAGASLAAYAAFFSVEGFWGLFVTGFAVAVIAGAIPPLVEGALLRRSVEGAALPYGVARGLGSAAFMIANVVGGLMVARFGIGVAAAWVVSAYVLATLTAVFALKPDPSPPAAGGMGFRGRLRAGASLMANRRFAIVVVGAGLVQAAHAFYYSFSTLVWKGQGVAEPVIGVLWAFGVIVEIGFLAALPWIERRLDPMALMVIGGAAGAVRWAAMALAPPLALLWPLQALHALTFAAVHVGAMRVVYREAPEAVAGLAQSIYAALGAGTLIGVSTLASGALYDAVAAKGYVAMSVMALAGLALLAGLARDERRGKAPPAPQRPPPSAAPD